MPPATSASRDVPDPTIDAPTDAIVKVTAGCICGSDLWPYRGENDIDAGRHDRPRVRRRRRGGRLRGHLVQARRLRDRAVLPLRQHLRRTAAPACSSACDNLGFTASGQAEYARVTQAEGSLVKTDGMPDAVADPVAADALRRDGHRLARAPSRPACARAAPRSSSATARSACAACWPPRSMGAEKVIAMSRHEPRQADRPPVRRHPHRRRARRGGRRARSRRSPAGSAPTPCSSASAPTPSMKQAFARRPPRAPRSASSACRTASSCRSAGCSRRTSAWPAAWRRCARYLPELLELVPDGAIDPGLVFDPTLPLDQVAEGYRAMDERAAIKVLIQP